MRRIGVCVVVLMLECMGGIANWVDFSPEGRGENYGILTGLVVLMCGDEEDRALGEEYRRVLEENVEDGELVDGLVRWVCWGDSLGKYWDSEGGFRMEEGACGAAWESSFACFVLGMCGETEYLDKTARWLSGQEIPEEALPFFLRLHGLLLAESVLADRFCSEGEREEFRRYCGGELSVLQTAIACHCGALLGDWDIAWGLRNRLLSLRNARGNWGDLVTTAYAELTLRAFRGTEQSLDVDLSVPAEGVRCTADRTHLRAIVFQQGTEASPSFDMEAYLLLQDGTEQFWGRSRVEGMDAGESVLVQITGVEPPADAQGMMLIADPRQETKDGDRSNNRCVLYWQKGIFVGELTVDGGHPDVVFCGAGRYAVVRGMVFASSEECRWELLDNGTIVAEGIGRGEISCDWRGSTGEHLMVLRAENDAGSASAEARVKVVEGTAHLHCDKACYGCREYVTFAAHKAFPEWIATLKVCDESGNEYGVPVAMGEDCFQWFTGSLPPGRYAGRLECRLPGTQAISATAEANFEIESMALRTETEICAPTQRRTVFQGESLTTDLVAQWKECVNDGSSAELTWQWSTEDGTVLLSGGWEISPDGSYLRESRGVVSLEFPEAGEYLLTVSVGGCVATERFFASQLPVLSVNAEAVPSRTGEFPTPGKTLIHLSSEAGEENGTELCSCEVKEMWEDGGVTLWRFRRKDGSLAEEGEFYATVASGQLEGDFAWDGKRGSGATVGVKIREGEARFRYVPAENLLLSGETATLLVRFFTTNEKEFGKVEMYLRGEEE